MPVAREIRDLLLAATRRPRADPRQLAACAAGVRDWSAVLQLAQEHRVLPMLAAGLLEIHGVPENIHTRLRAAFERNAMQNLLNAAELIGVVRDLGGAGIRSLPFKGLTLGASAYGDLTTRPAGDLDVLIHPRDIVAASAVVRARGYSLHTPTSDEGLPVIPEYFEYHFNRAADGMILEMRWRLDLNFNRYRHFVGFDWAWPTHITTLISGAAVPSLGPVCNLLMLCLHGSKHLWSRLIWICDVAQLLAVTPTPDWNHILREARRVGLSRALGLGVLLAHHVAAAPVPQGILRRFESDPTVAGLAAHFGHVLFDAPGTPPPGRVPYDIQLLSGADRVRLALQLLRPTERDRAVVRLPRPFHPLYYLIRPVRLVCDRSAR